MKKPSRKSLSADEHYTKIKLHLSFQKNRRAVVHPVYFFHCFDLNVLRTNDRQIFGIQAIRLYKDGAMVRSIGADELQLYNQSFKPVRPNDLIRVGTLTIFVENERKFKSIDGVNWGRMRVTDPNPTEWDGAAVDFRHKTEGGYGSVYTYPYQLVPDTSIARRLKIDAMMENQPS